MESGSTAIKSWTSLASIWPDNVIVLHKKNLFVIQNWGIFRFIFLTTEYNVLQYVYIKHHWPRKKMIGHRKKEKVIQTRITDNLYSKINKEAGTLGVSVSNLVRNVLFNAFDLVEDIVTDGKDIARTAQRNAYSILGIKKDLLAPDVSDGMPAPENTPGYYSQQITILGWQEAILNLNAICHECNAILPKGIKAAIAIMDGQGNRPIICIECLGKVTGAISSQPENEG